MIFSLFRKNTDTPQVYAVYNAIVAQSRQQKFYAEWGVPDTVTGRFDMISLHMALLFRRLRSEDKAVKAFSQAVFDLFFSDMDRSLREMGVGDLSIAKRIQKMGNLFFGFLASINAAMDTRNVQALEDVLSRNIYAGMEAPPVRLLAQYMISESEFLEAQSVAAIVSGQLSMNDAA
ncbi:MAG TPA: ubiquinol-cytochrome C chaperone family protein [Devosiaceae bacterium]|jgi:cytochrome b pre-mRNA-processing protein 3